MTKKEKWEEGWFLSWRVDNALRGCIKKNKMIA